MAAEAYEGKYKQESEEACERLGDAEAQKREYDLDIRESYFFTAPHRARELRSDQAISPTKPRDADVLQSGMAFELCKDFLTELLNGFMPQAENWAERRPGMFIPDEFKAEVIRLRDEQDPRIFDAIRASNLYQEVPKIAPDIAAGTAAFWISDPRPAENVVVQVVPLHELEINLGPFGEIDDRFVVRHTKNRHVKALLGEAIYDKLDEKCRKTIEDPKKRNQPTVLRWGYWRLWERMDDVVWKHVVMLDKKVVHTVELVGEGSCPLIPFRFNPSPEWAYGQGPTIESLPDFRQYDDLKAKKIEHVDRAISPPMGYPDESMAAIEGGVESGTWYPVRPGTEDAIKPLIQVGTMEPAIYEVSEIERALRHRYFVDFPQQRGDTPPTATQWLDEMQMALRRFGTPGASFWKECSAQVFLRFKHLLEKRGVIQPIQVNGKTVSLEPYNPAQRAAEQQEVAMFAHFAQIVAPLFPEEWRLETDGSATMNAVAAKMRVTDLWKTRSPDQKQQALGAISQLIQGRQQIRPSDPAGVAPL